MHQQKESESRLQQLELQLVEKASENSELERKVVEWQEKFAHINGKNKKLHEFMLQKNNPDFMLTEGEKITVEMI